MPSLTKKKINGKTYYYARESKWVNGKSKIVWQKYLGRAEDIIATMTGAREDPDPEKAIVTEFGAVAALYDLAQRLQLAEHIDRHVPKRGSGPSVGTYLLTAVLNRCVAPSSKASVADWFKRTALRRLVGIEARQLTSQRFWDNMNRLSREAISLIERDITAQMVRDFKIDLRRVLFDATNFFTFIDTFNDRSTLAQRGKSKEGRKALRIIGLALLVSADSHVPLLHQTYAGNQHDSKTFTGLTGELVARYKALTDGAEHVTIVFDKGNNSKDNLAAVDESPYHFVGSLVTTQHSELLEIPRKRYRSLADEGLPGVEVHRLKKVVFGTERTVLLTYNENLFLTQSKTILRDVSKRRSLLQAEQLRLRKWRTGKISNGKRPTIEAVDKKVNGWLKRQHMKKLLHVEVSEVEGFPKLTYHFDNQAWKRLQTTRLGKTILFTDNDDWTDAEIVRAYRGQYMVEEAFKRMKDPHHIALRPQHHWTDQKVEVHVFCCVLALTLCSLLRRELSQKGIDRSIPAILKDLSTIQEVAVVYPAKSKGGEPGMKVTLSELSEGQQALYEALDLARYRAT